MKKNKRNVKYIFLILSIIICSLGVIHGRNKKNILEDIPLVREYVFDLISLSKIDINNYSIDTNFKDSYSDKTVEEIWNESLSNKYIKEHNSNELKLSKSRKFVSKVADLFKEIHLTQIRFVKSNLIPSDKLEGEQSESTLNNFISDVEKNKKKLLSDMKIIEKEMKEDINSYIIFANKYNANIQISDEQKKYNEYFKNEYSDFLDKQFDSKLNEVLKN